MPDSTTTPPKEDPFDIGDTGIQMADEPKPGERPRGPDGKFLKVETPQNSPDEGKGQPVVEETPPPKPASKHPSYLVTQAREFGYEDDDIEAMTTTVLGKTIHKLLQQQLHYRSELDKERVMVHGQVRPLAPEPVPVEEDIPLDFGTDEDGRQLTEKDFHPGWVKAMKGIVRKNREENAKLQTELSKRDKLDQVREANRAAAIFDAAFVALGPEYEAIFGKGPGREMGQTQQDEYDNRIMLLTRAQADPRTQTPTQIKARVKAAAEKMFGKFIGKNPTPYAEVANGKAPKPRITPEQWEEGATARPTARQVDDEPPSEAKAVRNLTKKIDAITPVSDAEELDTLI